MKLSIRPITIFDGPLYVQFMDSLNYSHHPGWQGCYCRYYHNDCNDSDWNRREALENKQEALDAIAGGLMHGYLAFDEDKPIGWLNAGHWENYPRLKSILSKWSNLDTALMMCFLIKEDYRHQGIAKALCDFAEDDIKLLGYKKIIVVPYKNVENVEDAYRGTVSVFEKRGYKTREETDGYAIMSKWI